MLRPNLQLRFEKSILLFLGLWLLLGMALGIEFSNYNYVYTIMLFAVVLLHTTKKILYNTFLYLFLMLLFFLCVYVLSEKGLAYLGVNYFLFSAVYLISVQIHEIKFAYRRFYSRITFLFWGYLLLYFLGFLFFSHRLINPETGRYLGLLGSTNFSSSVVCLMLFYLFEYYQRIKKKRQALVFLICFGFYFFLIKITKSRTLFFALPFWFYAAYQVLSTKSALNRKVKSIILVLLCSLALLYFLNSIDILGLRERFRIEKDGSFRTRLFLYKNLWNGIRTNYFILPHGFDASYLLVHRITGTSHFPAHNDFLKYWYDLGVFFILILWKLWRNLKKVLLTKTGLTVVFFVASLALHNILFSPIIWLVLIPLLFIVKLEFIKADASSTQDIKKG